MTSPPTYAGRCRDWEAETLVTLGHIGPDGDALGHRSGDCPGRPAVGKKAYASFGEPFVVPVSSGFSTRCRCAARVAPDEIDVSSRATLPTSSRLGSAAEILERAKTVVVLDHHRSNDGFGDITVIDPDAAATAQLAYYLLLELGWPVDRIGGNRPPHRPRDGHRTIPVLGHDPRGTAGGGGACRGGRHARAGRPPCL